MIVTRRWLSEFVDLEGVSDSELYKTFNRIGLEVDRIENYAIAKGVVVGEVIECKKHPNADKLHVCSIDIGTGVRQIVCGAKNIRSAKYVAVATIGSRLPGDIEITHTKLRGVESEGMVCSSTELGFPEIEKGIWILDESLGKMEPGRELSSIEALNDTLIELELTANRGDCLSVYGVARDLAVGLGRKLKPFAYKQKSGFQLGIAREVDFQVEGEVEASVCYKLAVLEPFEVNALIRLRLALAGKEIEENLDAVLEYVSHTTGVLLRGYDGESIRRNGKISIKIKQKQKGKVEVLGGGDEMPLGVIGAYQEESAKAHDKSKYVLLEASYIDPESLIEAVAVNKIPTDHHYYQSSRGSNPDLFFGLEYLHFLCDEECMPKWYEGGYEYTYEHERKKLVMHAKNISNIIGQEIEQGLIVKVLQRLGFGVQNKEDDVLVVTVPPFRHDIKNVQDVAEEILRIVGIDTIQAKPLRFRERIAMNGALRRHNELKKIRQSAVSQGFFEHISYLFTQKSLLEKYGFDMLIEQKDLANPIAEDFNTLRTTLIPNLLTALKRNINFSRKSVLLFEVGTVYNAQREPEERIAFLASGQIEPEGVLNSGKPKRVDFGSFVEKLGAIIGDFELSPLESQNSIMHTYQSAELFVNKKSCGYIYRVHPEVSKEWGVEDTYLAEFSLDLLLPEFKTAKQISKFQGAYKDLSIRIDKRLPFSKVRRVVEELNEPNLKFFYPIDVYEDEALGDDKSLTLRFFIQSEEKTLQDSDIERVMRNILSELEQAFGAKLR